MPVVRISQAVMDRLSNLPHVHYDTLCQQRGKALGQGNKKLAAILWKQIVAVKKVANKISRLKKQSAAAKKAHCYHEAACIDEEIFVLENAHAANS